MRPALVPTIAAGAATLLWAGVTRAAPSPDQRCLQAIGALGRSVVAKTFAAVDRCHRGAEQDASPATCGDADPLHKLAGLLLGRLYRKCDGATATIAAYPNGGPREAVARLVAAEAAASSRALQAPGSEAGGSVTRCRRAVGKARSRIVTALVRDAVACQKKHASLSPQLLGLAPQALDGPCPR